jgi:hypothetical protein
MAETYNININIVGSPPLFFIIQNFILSLGPAAVFILRGHTTLCEAYGAKGIKQKGTVI